MNADLKVTHDDRGEKVREARAGGCISNENQHFSKGNHHFAAGDHHFSNQKSSFLRARTDECQSQRAHRDDPVECLHGVKNRHQIQPK